MNREQEFTKMKEDYCNMQVPIQTREKMEEAIMRAKMDKKRVMRKREIRNLAIGMAAALAIVILPNTSADVAYAMERIPVLGEFFKLITIREYTYEDETHQASVEVPQIEAMELQEQDSASEKNVADATAEAEKQNEAIEVVNKSIAEYTDELIAKFEEDMKAEGFSALNVTYETVTDTDTWFTLCLDAEEIQASGYVMKNFYHIDKTTGQVATLQDLFADDSYKAVISEEILSQMRAQMEAEEAIYFIDPEDETVEPFTQISEDESFYFNTKGNLVIVFDEYEVGPGYIGCPEFEIPAEILENMLK